MKQIKNYLIIVLAIGGMTACNHNRQAKLDKTSMNSDSAIMARANFIADSIARANYKPDTTFRLDTARILSNPNYAFVHNCYKNNCKQMEIIHFGMVNGFDKKIKLASRKMMSDYEKLHAQLRDYAIRNHVPLSNDTTIDLSYANTMDGYTWDSTWVDLVLHDQSETLSTFQQAEKAVNDEQLLSIIKEHQPYISRHIEVASNLRKGY